MIDELGGLPAHPLVVHLPVVLIPLATLGVIAMAVRPAWLRTFGPVVAGMAGVGFVAAILAASTGEALEDDFRASGQTISDTLRDHAEMGEGARVFAALFFAVVLVWVLFARWRARAGEERAAAVVKRPRHLGVALAVLAVLAGGTATVSVYLTGHSGATSVWEEPEP